MRLAAIRACSVLEIPEAPTLLLALYPKATPDHQRAIVETLSTRKAYAEALFQAMRDGRGPPRRRPGLRRPLARRHPR